MSWTYEQSTGKLFNSSGELISSGYAGGNCGKNPEGKNNCSMQDVKHVGPLPQGLYYLSGPINHSHLGPFAIPLEPDENNTMFGRGGFFCHGDTNPPGNASEGCIIMPRNIREMMWYSNDHELKVVEKI